MRSYRRKPTHEWWHEAHDRYPTGMIRLGSIGVPKPMLPPMRCAPEQSVSADTPEALASVLIKRIQACALRGFYFLHWLEQGAGYARFQVVYRGTPSHISLQVVQLRRRSPRQLERDLRATFRALHGRRRTARRGSTRRQPPALDRPLASSRWSTNRARRAGRASRPP